MKFVYTKKGKTTYFFHPSLLLLFLDPGSGMGRNLDPESGINIPDPQHCSQGCEGWNEERGILYIKASVVGWKDISPWQPEFGPEEKHFVSGHFAGFSQYISSEGSA